MKYILCLAPILHKDLPISACALTMATLHRGQIAHEDGHKGLPRSEIKIIIFVPLMVLVLIFFLRCIYCLSDARLRRRRLRLALHDPAQSKFAQPSTIKAFLNRHLIHAPLCRIRHNREFRSIGRGFHFGTIPTRAETIFLCTYALLNAAVCFAPINWLDGIFPSLNDLRASSGTLAVANLVPLVILAGRNNPLISLLGIPFDTFNLVHRWIGRIIVAEGIIHAVSVLVGIGIESELSSPDFETHKR
jgi:hypothetical protein